MCIYVLRIPSGNFNAMTGNNAVPQIADITIMGTELESTTVLRGGEQDGDLLLEHSPFEIDPMK